MLSFEKILKQAMQRYLVSLENWFRSSASMDLIYTLKLHPKDDN